MCNTVNYHITMCPMVYYIIYILLYSLSKTKELIKSMEITLGFMDRVNGTFPVLHLLNSVETFEIGVAGYIYLLPSPIINTSV